MDSGAKSSMQVIVADVLSCENCDDRAVWVMRAASEISGDTGAVGTLTLTCTMSPGAAPAQNGHAAGWAAASTVTACTLFWGLR